MIQEYIDNPLYSCWPFWVLGLTPSAQESEIEKAARDITAKITLGIPSASEYQTPNGLKQRDEFLIREAKSALQDASKRIVAEFWYIDPATDFKDAEDSHTLSAEEWQEALGVKVW